MINEGKQVGVIYHYTKLDYLEALIKSGWKMRSRNGETISFTRNFDLWVIGGDISVHRGYVVRLAFDGTKMSNKHKISPLAGLKDDEKNVWDPKHNKGYRVDRSSGEAEEALVGQGVDVEPYLLQVDILKMRDDEERVEKIKQLLPKGVVFNHTRKLQSVKEDVRRDFAEATDVTFYILMKP
jgi:hypothetical protein